ncbi:MAG TPA: TIGR03619 family F420-dependent LLM class oxidoreductase [Jatrophihabitans sp.]|jgi:probable F420-dependent oxidoreductase
MDLVRLGFGLPVSGSWARRDNLVTIAERAEAAGYQSLWAFQRLLHPAEGDWGPMYHSVTDPLITLAHVAALTRTARLGVAVLNAPFFTPILLAKQLNTLDELSAGRLDVGLGLGWAKEEFAASGVPFERRGARTDEFIRCLTAIWTQPTVEFVGEFYSMPPSQVRPPPVQSPHPPLLLGGGADAALRRAGRLGDGWISASRHNLTDIGQAISTIRAAATEAGREADAMRYIVRGVLSLHDISGDDEAARRPLHGTEQQIRDDLKRLAEQGVTEVFLDLNFDPEIGNPDADPKASMQRAERILDTFAPATEMTTR